MCRAHDVCGSIGSSVSLHIAADGVSRRQLLRYGLLLGAAAVGGCASTNAKPPAGDPASLENHPTAQITNTDECADRLHDISGALGSYYKSRLQLPSRLEEVRKQPGFSFLELTCPVSKLPYVYNPIGIITPDNQPRMICYDPAPSHSGMRWAIQFIEPKGNLAPYTKVVAVPESGFTLKLPR